MVSSQAKIRSFDLTGRSWAKETKTTQFRCKEAVEMGAARRNKRSSLRNQIKPTNKKKNLQGVRKKEGNLIQ